MVFFGNYRSRIDTYAIYILIMTVRWIFSISFSFLFFAKKNLNWPLKSTLFFTECVFVWVCCSFCFLVFFFTKTAYIKEAFFRHHWCHAWTNKIFSSMIWPRLYNGLKDFAWSKLRSIFPIKKWLKHLFHRLKWLNNNYNVRIYNWIALLLTSYKVRYM